MGLATRAGAEDGIKNRHDTSFSEGMSPHRIHLSGKGLSLGRLELTASAVKSSRLEGRGVAARIFWLESPGGEIAHDGRRMTGATEKVKPRRSPLSKRGR